MGCGLGSNANDTGCCVGGPETTCGGVGSACLESSGNMFTTTDWSYVGQGRGGYSAAPSYNYVGEGAGAYSKDVIVTPFGCRIRPCSFCCCCWQRGFHCCIGSSNQNVAACLAEGQSAKNHRS